MGNPQVTMMSPSDFEKLHLQAWHDYVSPKTWLRGRKRLEELGLGIPVVKDLDAEILRAVEAGGVLRMCYWHGGGSADCYNLEDEDAWNEAVCGTTHCRAGWSIHLAGEAGMELEKAFGPEVAGAFIYAASTGRVPDFFASDDEAMADIRRCAGVV